MSDTLHKFECEADEHNEDIVALCCTDCRHDKRHADLMTRGQLYHCSACDSDWRIGRPAPTPHSPLASVSNAVHIGLNLLLVIAGFLVAMTVGAWIILRNNLHDDWRVFVVIAMMVLLMVATIHLLWFIFDGIIYLVQRAYHSLLNEPVRPWRDNA